VLGIFDGQIWISLPSTCSEKTPSPSQSQQPSPAPVPCLTALETPHTVSPITLGPLSLMQEPPPILPQIPLTVTELPCSLTVTELSCSLHRLLALPYLLYNIWLLPHLRFPSILCMYVQNPRTNFSFSSDSVHDWVYCSDFSSHTIHECQLFYAGLKDVNTECWT